ncbi:MAG: hypothetical protein ACLR0U_26560 [Enterocloster clostridioformis]
MYPTRKKPETAAMIADIRYAENVTLPVCIPENLAACSLVPTEYIFLPWEYSAKAINGHGCHDSPYDHNTGEDAYEALAADGL